MTHRAGFVGRMGPPYVRRYDPAASSLFARMSTQPDSTRKSLYNDLITGIKADGDWESLDALCVIAAHDSQAGSLNIIKDDHNLTYVNSPTFTVDRGVNGDGVSSYADTNYNPATQAVNFTQNAGTFGIWSLTSAQSMSSAAGWFDGTDGITILNRSPGDTFNYRTNSASLSTSVSNLDGRGFYVARRISSTAQRGYKDGVTVSDYNSASTALNSNNLYLGRSTATGYSSTQIAAWSIGNLDDAGVARVTARLRTYLVAVGAVAA